MNQFDLSTINKDVKQVVKDLIEGNTIPVEELFK